MKLDSTRLRLLILASMLLLMAVSCQRDLATYYPEWGKSRWERLDLFRNIESLAIAPIEIGERIDKSKMKYVRQLDAALFDQVMRRQRFRLVSPEDFARALKEAAGETDGESAAPRDSLTSEPLLIRNRNDSQALIKAAGKTGADAVLQVRVEDIDPYFPPRVVLRARVYMSRQVSLSDQAIINMTDDGVPMDVPRTLRERFIWQTDMVLDAHEDRTMSMVRAFARQHEVRYHGFGPEIFVRSMLRYADFVGAVIAGQLFKDAEFYKTIDRYRMGVRARGLVETGDDTDEKPVIPMH
ncbi:MAG: hypothetical protein JW909_08790 [Planctomycetes bacterium]|nr:hypothetical protein [Planctomycetota bacterium]